MDMEMEWNGSTMEEWTDLEGMEWNGWNDLNGMEWIWERGYKVKVHDILDFRHVALGRCAYLRLAIARRAEYQC